MRRRMSLKSSGSIAKELLTSQSDDQLYRGGRRKSIIPMIPKAGGVVSGADGKADKKDIKTSSGGPVYRRKIIEFEGDGPLGIIFRNNNGLMSIKSIMEGSVASEYFEISKGMNVIQINNIPCRDLGYFKSMERLGNLWKENSCITLHFEYENIDDMINNPIFNPIYKFLEGVDCEDYYGDFVELGATQLEDLNFIEYDDLVKMKMPPLKRRNLQEILTGEYKDDIYKSKLNIYFNPNLVEKEKEKELERIKKLHSQKFQIEVIDYIDDDIEADDV